METKIKTNGKAPLFVAGGLSRHLYGNCNRFLQLQVQLKNGGWAVVNMFSDAAEVPRNFCAAETWIKDPDLTVNLGDIAQIKCTANAVLYNREGAVIFDGLSNEVKEALVSRWHW